MRQFPSPPKCWAVSAMHAIGFLPGSDGTRGMYFLIQLANEI